MKICVAVHGVDDGGIWEAAEVDLLDAQIMTIDRPATMLDERRIRRARNRVMAARRALTNRTGAVQSGGAA
ncbi:DUF6284 family protein [Streptomyces sp. NPDC006324]|uniref:DUF6284 family protein n=1 Tax=Streptomyces sp. NPDC006324 TaxID=3156751 RepID=UPI0033B5BD37